MSQLSKILGRFAPGHKLDYAGKTYEFKSIGHEQRVAIQKGWRKHLADLAREYHADGELTDDELREELAGLRKQAERGEFDLAGAGGQRMASCYDGRVFLLQQITGASAQEAETLMQARTIEVTELIQMVFLESFPELKQRALAAEAEEAQKHSCPPA